MSVFRVRQATPLIALLALQALPVAAAPADWAGRRVAEIRFEPPDPILVPDEQARLLAVRVGEPLDLQALQTTIEGLFATGRFSDIVVDASAADGGGVALRFQVRRAWFVSRVAVEGVPEPPNAAQLANATKLELGAEFYRERVEEAVKNLANVLRNNGFYRPSIKPDIERVADTQEVNIVFRVQPGERAKFTRPDVTGEPLRPPEEIIADTRWARWWVLPGWKPVTELRVQQGLDRVRRSYQKIDRLMARVTLADTAYDPENATLKPTIRAVAGPEVRVRVAGAKISRGKLKELVPVFEEQSVDRDLLVEGMRNIASYFQGRGFFDAKAEFNFKQTGTDEQTIEYSVVRGVRHKIVLVDVSGNRYFDDKTLRERMYTTPASFIRFRHGRYSREYADRDREAILNLYRSNGFADVDVKFRVVENYRSRPNEEAVFVEVTEGRQWFVSNLEVSGVDLRLYEYITGLLTSTVGQPYSEFNVATDRDNVLNYYYNNGYPDARFEVVSRPDPATRQVALRYNVIEGRRQFLRDVIIGGLGYTNPDVVFNLIQMEPGDPLSQSSITESQRRLYDLGIFAKVDTGIQNPNGLTRSKYVLYQFEEARRYSLTGGLGAEIARIGGDQTSYDAPAGGTGFSPRVSLGISRLNFLGIGHTVGLQTRFSNIQRRALINYLAPRFKDNEALSLSFTGLYDDLRNVRTFSSRRLEATAQLSQRLSRANTIQYRLTYRRVSVDSNTLKIEPGLIPILSQPVRVGLVSASFIQDRRDDPAEPRRGIYNTIDVGVATKGLASQTDFLRLLGRNASYHRIGNNEWIFARTLTFGWTNNFGSREIPLPERFFGGGAASHRGFPENQAGPRDLVTGFPIGGNAILVNQLELRFPLLGENVGGVFFHDAGNVYTSLKDISFRYNQRNVQDFNYMVHALGMGIRYRTPVGPIRVDLAFSANSPRFIGFKGTREELLAGTGQRNVMQRISRFQFHFSLGQSF